MKLAYVKTQMAMRTDPHVRSQFNKRFIERLHDWDAVTRMYLVRNRSSNGTAWKSRVEKYLGKRDYQKESIEEHCRALNDLSDFIEEYAFLFRSRRRS